MMPTVPSDKGPTKTPEYILINDPQAMLAKQTGENAMKLPNTQVAKSGSIENRPGPNVQGTVTTAFAQATAEAINKQIIRSTKGETGFTNDQPEYDIPNGGNK